MHVTMAETKSTLRSIGGCSGYFLLVQLVPRMSHPAYPLNSIVVVFVASTQFIITLIGPIGR